MAPATAAAPVAVVQSPQDKRQYKRLRLQNGLDVLLIHDPEMAEALEGRSDDGQEEDGYESDDEGDEEDEEDMDEDMADEVRREASIFIATTVQHSLYSSGLHKLCCCAGRGRTQGLSSQAGQSREEGVLQRPHRCHRPHLGRRVQSY